MNTMRIRILLAATCLWAQAGLRQAQSHRSLVIRLQNLYVNQHHHHFVFRRHLPAPLKLAQLQQLYHLLLSQHL